MVHIISSYLVRVHCLSCSEALRSWCNSSPCHRHIIRMKMYFVWLFPCWVGTYKLCKLLGKRFRFQSFGFDCQLQQKLQILEIIWRSSGWRGCALRHLALTSWQMMEQTAHPARPAKEILLAKWGKGGIKAYENKNMRAYRNRSGLRKTALRSSTSHCQKDF